jgi:hypothetical protein
MQRQFKGKSPMKIFNKSIFLAALVFLGGQVFAADQVAILGTWVSTLAAQGQSINLELEIRNGSNGLEATMAGPQGKNSLEEFKFDGKEVSFKSAATGNTVSLGLANDQLRGELSGPQGAIPLVFSKVQ